MLLFLFASLPVVLSLLVPKKKVLSEPKWKARTPCSDGVPTLSSLGRNGQFFLPGSLAKLEFCVVAFTFHQSLIQQKHLGSLNQPNVHKKIHAGNHSISNYGQYSEDARSFSMIQHYVNSYMELFDILSSALVRWDDFHPHDLN